MRWSGSRRFLGIRNTFSGPSNDMLVSLSMGHTGENLLNSHEGLVNSLVNSNILLSTEVKKCFKSLDRKHFAPGNELPYEYKPYTVLRTSVGDDVKLTSPHMHVIGLEALKDTIIGSSRRALDLGTGSGFIALSMYLMNSKLHVTAVDRLEEVIEVARTCINNACKSHHNITFVTGIENLDPYCPFDVIHVGFCMDSVKVKDTLWPLLNPGGQLLVPEGYPGHEQELMLYTKDQSTLSVTSKVIMKCMYAPDESSKLKQPKLTPEENDKLREQLTESLKTWRLEFNNKHNRVPNLQDMKNDTEMKELLLKLRS